MNMNGGDWYGGNGSGIGMEREYIRRHHRHQPRDNQCTSALVKHIRAPVPLVSNWLLTPNYIPSSIQYHIYIYIYMIHSFEEDMFRFVSFHLIDCVVLCCVWVWYSLISKVWSLVRRFDEPQKYKPFVSRCIVQGGGLGVGTLREVNVKSGLPATTSTERLEQLDDHERILGVRIVGGDHRLNVSHVMYSPPPSPLLLKS